jgi:hypothetical protein
LSDEYLKLNTGAERQQFLTENFGRASAGWAEVMSQGSKAIQDRSASIEDGLILSQKDIDMSRKMQYQQDALSDAMLVLKTTIGKDLLPELIKLADHTIKAVQGWQKFFDVIKYNNSVTDLAAQLAKADGYTYEAYRRSSELHDKYIQLAIAQVDAAEAQEELNEQLQEGADDTDNMAESVKDYAGELDNITGFASSYRGGVEDIRTAEQNLKDAEAELHALQAEGWTASSEQVVNAKAKVDEMRGALGEAKNSARDATNEMIAGFLQAQLSIDGTFTEGDMQRVIDYRLAVGLLTQEEYNAALQAIGLASAIATIQDKDVRVRVYYEQYGEAAEMSHAQWWQATNGGNTNPNAGNTVPSSGGGKQKLAPWASASDIAYAKAHPEIFDTTGYAVGGSFVVPPGYPNDSYFARFSTGETVDIRKPGENKTGVVVNLNATVGNAIDIEKLAYKVAGVIARKVT